MHRWTAAFLLTARTTITHRLPSLVVLHPMHSVSAKEAALLARRLGLPNCPPAIPKASKRSINQLAEGFVLGLQQSMPSAVATITKTAGKLQRYPWTEAPPPRGEGAGAAVAAPQLCAVCTAPLHANEDAWACRSCMLGLFADRVGEQEDVGLEALAALVADAVGRLDSRDAGALMKADMLRQQVETYLL